VLKHDDEVIKFGDTQQTIYLLWRWTTSRVPSTV